MTITRNKRSRIQRKSRRNLKGGNDSNWADYKLLVKKKKITNKDICPLCQEEFSRTRDKVIYKLTCCGQFVHNNCVSDYCDDKSKKQLVEFRSNVAAGNPNLPSTIQTTCPMCRKEEGDPSISRGYCGFSCDCAEVSGFKDKSFADEHIERILGKGSRVLAMYHAQP